MKFTIALLTLAVVATGSQAFRWQLPSIISRELPSFCHDDPCPGYDVKERGPQNTYEVRVYDQVTPPVLVLLATSVVDEQSNMPPSQQQHQHHRVLFFTTDNPVFE